MNVKALTIALAGGAAFFYLIYVTFMLIVPVDYQSGVGIWLPVFHAITPWGFLLGLVQTVVLGALVGLVIGALHNFFQHRWTAVH